MQADSQQIPYLLALLDDQDPTVQDQVHQALQAFGDNLEHLLTPYLDEMSPQAQKLVQHWCAEIRVARFQAHWMDWLDQDDDKAALEEALAWLSYLQADWAPFPLRDLLDQLARRYREAYAEGDITDMMHFLFVEQGFLPPEKDYYHPRNSNLVTVINRRRGLQISLACVAILVGHRLDLAVEGFNMPGHFMVMADDHGMVMLFDVFNQGQPLPAQAHAYLEQSLTMQEVSLHDLQARSYQIVLRVLRNLINAYQHQSNHDQMRFFQTLLEDLVQALKTKGINLA
jgi:regulator of sirC expression with transglutaminase-like and TPR domain